MPLRSLRLLWIALFVSVGINLFVAGMLVAGHFFQPPKIAQMKKKAPRFFRFRAALRTLPDAKQAELRQQLRQRLQTVRALWREARQARRAVRAAMRQEPFDAAVVKAAYQKLRDKRNAAAAQLHQTMADILAQLTPAERQAFLRAGYRRPHRRPPPHHRPHRRPEHRQ